MLKWCTLVHAWNQFQRAPPFRIFAACRSNTRMRLCAPSTKLHRSETMLHRTMTHWNVRMRIVSLGLSAPGMPC